jgi:two-component system, NarL family, response regulator NreC
MEMREIKVMLVDDHDVVRTGLKSYLESQPGLVVIAQAGSGEEALVLAEKHQPDVVVMDITMPNMDGLEATRRLKVLCPGSRVLALTVHEDKQYFFEMLAAGASGYLTKQAAADELTTAIRMVANGNVYLQPVLARWLLDDYRRLSDLSPAEEAPAAESGEKKSTKDVLSKREREVLELVAEGLTTPLISERLGISPKTVARHRERIMSKLNMHSSTELVRYAIKTGLIKL